MNTTELRLWDQKLKNHIALHHMTSGDQSRANDPAHDLEHFERVVESARAIATIEGARLEVVIPAAWLHDLVNVPKNDPRRGQASRMSAAAAVRLLRSMEYPEQYFDDIAHAIEAHSFSARISPLTLEARVVQDADRLDALGAVGIARLFSCGAQMGAKFYNAADPMARNRELDDKKFSLDHFFMKLFPVVESLQTQTGRKEGMKRLEFMRLFLSRILTEIRGDLGLSQGMASSMANSKLDLSLNTASVGATEPKRKKTSKISKNIKVPRPEVLN